MLNCLKVSLQTSAVRTMRTDSVGSQSMEKTPSFMSFIFKTLCSHETFSIILLIKGESLASASPVRVSEVTRYGKGRRDLYESLKRANCSGNKYLPRQVVDASFLEVSEARLVKALSNLI